jgi:AcrR family transcriptional regulator
MLRVMNERSFRRSTVSAPAFWRVGKVELPGSSLPAGTRRRILHTALQLFATRGYAGTSIRDIAAVLDLRPSALYAHFRSKEQVLAEISEVGHAAHAAALDEAVAAASDDPVAQLRALARAHALFHTRYPHVSVVVNEELYSLPAELAAPSLSIRARATKLLTDILQRGVDAGVFDVPDPTLSAAAIAAMSMRLPYRFAPGGSLDAAAVADHHADLALRIVGVHDQRQPPRRRA